VKATYSLSQSTVPIGEVTQVSLMVRFGADRTKDKADASPRRPLNLSLVLDRSGSMGGTPLRQALKSAKALVAELTEQDQLSVVTFDDHIDTLVAPAFVKDKGAIQSAIDKVRAGGTTNLCGGWETGGKHVQKNFSQAQVNRVLLLTDGHANCGTTDTPSLVKLAAQKAAAGVATTTLGFGTNFNEDLLIGMARAGEGNFYYIESHEDLSQVLQIELEGLSSVCGQNLTVKIQPHAALQKSAVLNQYRTEQKGDSLQVTVGDVYAVEDKVLALDLWVKPAARGGCPVATIAFSYRVVDGASSRDVTEQLIIELTAASHEEALASPPNVAVIGEALRQRIAKAKEVAVELADKGQHKEAAKQLREIAESLRQSPVANQFEFSEENELLEHFAERLASTSYDSVLRKELRDQSYQAATRSRADLGQRGTAGGSASGLPTVTSADGGVALRCEKVSGKLRIRVTSDGFDGTKNVQFPRAIREEGVSYLVEQVVPSSDGSYYRVQGKIQRLLRPGETVSSGRAGTRSTASSKPAKTPKTAADLPTCTEIGTGVLVQCVQEGSKLRARVVTDGFNPDWNIRFPRSVRELGILYVCDAVVEAAGGGSYVAQGEVKRLIQ
jgi:Ca-activated chloride channel family protein